MASNEIQELAARLNKLVAREGAAKCCNSFQTSIVERLCKIGGKVAQEKFDWGKAADCICPSEKDDLTFNYDAEVIEFIEQAVQEKLAREA